MEPTPPQSPPATKPRRRRRWLRWLGLALVVLVGLLAGAWLLAPGIVAGRTEAALERALAVDATVEGVRLSLAGEAEVASVRLVDLQGREVLGLWDLTARASIGALLGGALDGSASVGRVAVTIRQREDGTWSTSSLPRREGDGAPPADERPGEGAPGPLPRIDFTLAAPSLVLAVEPHGAGATTVALGLLATVSDGDTVALEELSVEAEALNGTASGRLENLSGWRADPTSPLRLRALAADLRYVPDALRTALAPWVELDLQGAEEQPLRVQLEGDLTDLGPPAALRALAGELEAGVGRLTVANFTAAGDVAARLAEGRLRLTSDLGMNGGQCELGLDVDVAGLLSETGARESRLTVALAEVGVGAEFRPLLAALHPMLAASEALAQGSFGGDVDATVDFAVAAPLRLEDLQASPAEAVLGSLDADGALALSAALRDVPLVQALGEALGIDLASGARIEPFEFRVRDGRIGYEEPWTWTIDGIQTRFTGSVGLDRTLDLVWRLPIDARLARKRSLFARLEGETLAIPLGGTLLSPRLDLEQGLTELMREGLGSTLEQELRERFEELDLPKGLEGVGGGGFGSVLDELGRSIGERSGAGAGGEGDDPAALLREADRLWSAGDEAAARPLYRRLREQFALSPAYLLNRRRVKDRADQES